MMAWTIDEAVEIFTSHFAASCPFIAETEEIMSIKQGAKQSGIDIRIMQQELQLKRKQLSAHILEPAAFALAKHLEQNEAKYTYKLAGPKEYEHSFSARNGCKIRGILALYQRQEGSTEIRNILRFDILWSK